MYLSFVFSRLRVDPIFASELNNNIFEMEENNIRRFKCMQTVKRCRQTNKLILCVYCVYFKRDKIYPSNENRGVIVENVYHLNQRNKNEKHPPNKMIKRYKIWEQRLDGYSQFHY